MTINTLTLRRIILPIRVGIDPMERLLVASFKGDPEFEGLEPQVFDDPINGRGMRVLRYRKDGKVDVYWQPGVYVDRRIFAVGKGIGDFAETTMEPAHLKITELGVDLHVAFTDAQGRLHEGDRIFNTTILEPYSVSTDVMNDLENENKIRDTVLLPGQSLNGIVVFPVNSLYNKSFLLKYYTTTVTSASFEKSIEALRTADHFNYVTALGIPPYNICRRSDGSGYSYRPLFNDRCDTWANWVNRSVFETFQKSDVERMRKLPPNNILRIEMVYALRVIPERNITMHPVTTLFNKSELLVTDDTGEEIINTSRIEGMAVMSNKTYIFKLQWDINFPGMNISNASVVRISFWGLYFASGRLSINNQDVILDDKLNIIVVRNYPGQFLI